MNEEKIIRQAVYSDLRARWSFTRRRLDDLRVEGERWSEVEAGTGATACVIRTPSGEFFRVRVERIPQM